MVITPSDPACWEHSRVSWKLSYLEHIGGSTGHWWSRRLTIVRGFARYLHTLVPGTQVPPRSAPMLATSILTAICCGYATASSTSRANCRCTRRPCRHGLSAASRNLLPSRHP